MISQKNIPYPVKQKALVYPFDRQFLPFVRRKRHPHSLEFVHYVSPNGWGFEGKDAGTVDYGSPLGTAVSCDFDLALASCDAAVFVEADTPLDKGSYILPKMRQALEAGKDVHCCIRLEPEEYDALRGRAAERDRVFEYYCDMPEQSGRPLEKSPALKELHTPVLMVCGIVEGVGKFDAQLALAGQIRDSGAKASVITSRSCGRFAGEHSCPGFLFDPISEAEKIFRFNALAARIEKEESPDLIIIGVPGALLPLDAMNTGWFGVTAYEITRAVQADAALACMYYENYSPEYLSDFERICKYRFSLDITAYILENTALDFNDWDVFRMVIEPSLMQSNPLLKNREAPAFPYAEKQAAFDHVLACLSGNAVMEAI